MISFIFPLFLLLIAGNSFHENSYSDYSDIATVEEYDDETHSEPEIAVVEFEDEDQEDDENCSCGASEDSYPSSGIHADVKMYLNTSADMQERIQDILMRMSLTEKSRQINMGSLSNGKDEETYGAIEVPVMNATDFAQQAHGIKTYIREESKIQNPPLFIARGTHGIMLFGATIFPQTIAQGSTWNPELIKLMASAIALEASACGIDQILGPNLEVSYDARSGGTEERFGEDPFLVGKMAQAFVNGLQGNIDEDSQIIADDKVIATPLNYGGSTQYSNIGYRDYLNNELIAFRILFENADSILSVAPSYGSVDAIPAHSNKQLLDEILRSNLHFSGYVISAPNGLSLLKKHNIGNSEYFIDESDASLDGGVNFNASAMNIFSEEKFNEYEELSYYQDRITEAIRNVLWVKLKTGMLERDLPRVDDIDVTLRNDWHLTIAEKVAEESIVLLKNENAVLPLDAQKIKKIAVIGKYAKYVQNGTLSYRNDGTSLLQALQDKFGGSMEINYVNDDEQNDTAFDATVSLAKESDVVIVVLGESSTPLSPVEMAFPDENDKAFLLENAKDYAAGRAFDTIDLSPPVKQRELLKQLHATGKPIILVYIHSRPWSIDWESENIPAILEAWYPGECGGQALANIIFGEVNPSGKLPVSIPRAKTFLPFYYNQSRKNVYADDSTQKQKAALYPFGHGLSYTSFKYSDLNIYNELHEDSDSAYLRITAKVTNTGTRDGKEVVQLYIRRKSASIALPEKSLFGFAKIELAAGESEEIEFRVFDHDLRFYDVDMDFVLEPTSIEIQIGSSSEDIRLHRKIDIYEEPRSEG